MRVSSLVFVLGLAAAAGVLGAVGCSSDETGAGSASSQSTSSQAASSGSASGSTSGSTGGGGESSASSTSSTSSGTGGGSGAYKTCGDCTSGSEAKECASQKTACDKDQGCVDIYNCVYGLAGTDGCSTNKEGGCCTLKCFTDTGASMASVNLYKAFDNCVYCQTCKTICTDPPTYDATEYCKATSSASSCP